MLSDAGCVCIPETKEQAKYDYWVWAAQGFATCAFTPYEKAAFVFGLISLLLWVVVMAPQIWETFRSKQVESISLGLWGIWLVGDALNTISCVLTAATPSQLYVAVYYCFTDMIMVLQYVYYSRIYPKIQARKQQKEAQKSVLNTMAIGVAALVTLRMASDFLPSMLASDISVGTGAFTDTLSIESIGQHRVLMSTSPTSPLDGVADGPNKCNFEPELSDGVKIAGYVLAWICALLYFTSRIPQIYKNYKGKNVDGLSPALFAIALCANICYGLNIILNLPIINTDFFAGKLPFIVGSLGTIIFDVMLLVQLYRYRNRNKVHNGSSYEKIED